MSPRRRAFVYFLFCVGWFLFPVFWIESKPTGFRLKSGDALPPVFENGTFLIRSGERAVIDWEAFSIALQEEVRFQQAGAHSAVLNCVTGRERSELLGTLTSNGAVYLINPNGILIGEEARIETAGFIASTLGLSGDTLSDEERFFQGESSEGVVNRGYIHCPAGDIFLIGKTIDNSGTVSAPEGRQGLLAGCEVWIRPFGAPEMHIRSEEPVDVETLKENPYALAIRHSGTSLGKEVYCISEGGLSEVVGEITAVNANQGGHVQVLGCQVHLLDAARIRASGLNGGGEVLVGGDYQGGNPNVGNANYVWVGPKVEVDADAIQEGPGGKVIFWGNQQNHYYGKTSVRGGELGGDGGLVEVSAAYLNFNGMADRSAPCGKGGILLLDPSDITISAAASSNVTSTPPPIIWSGTAATCFLSVADLTGGLASGDVTVTTVSGAGGLGTITVSGTVNWSAATQLTLLAERNIVITSDIENTNAGVTPFTAMNFTAQGIGSGASLSGIEVGSTARVRSQTGNIIMAGRSPGNIGGACNGITIFGTVSVISGGQGYIQLTGTGGTGGSGLDNQNVGISTRPLSWVTSTSNLTGTATSAIRLIGQGGAGGASGSSNNVGVRLAGNAICFAAGDILVTGTGGTGQGSFHFGSDIIATTTVDSGTLRFLNCTGGTSNVEGVGNANIGVQWSSNNCVVTGTAGAVIFENCNGGGGTGSTGNNHGVFFGGTQTTILGSLEFLNCSGGKATSGLASLGVFQNGGTLLVTGTLSTKNGITMTNCTGGRAPSGNSINGCVGIQISGTMGVLGSSAGISLGGVGGGNAVGDTSSGHAGVLITGSGNLVNQNGTGGITISGTGGFGSGGSNHGVSCIGTILGAANAVNGSITITGTARQADSSSNGVLCTGTGRILTSTSAGGNISITGAVTGTGAPLALSGTNATSSFQTLAGTILFTGTTNLGSGSGTVIVSSTGGNITFPNQVNLVSGNSTVSFTGTGAGDITFTEIIDGARTLTLSNVGTGNIKLQKNVGPTNRLTGLTLTGTNSTLQLGNVSGITLQLNNAALIVPMAVSLLGGTSTINTGVTGGAIFFSKAINGAQGLTLQAGTGDIDFVQNVGTSLTPLGPLIISTVNNLTAATITATSITQTAGTGTTLFKEAVQTTATAPGGTISLTGQNFTFNDDVTATGDVTVAMDGGLLSITSSLGPIMNIQGAFEQTQTSPSTVNLKGTINTTNGDITFASPLTLTGNGSLTAVGSPANLLFNGAINGGFALTLAADETITFDSGVGGGTPLGSLQVTAGGEITLGGDQTVASGPMIYNGTVVLTQPTFLIDDGSGAMQFLLPSSSNAGESIVGNFDLTLEAFNTTITVEGDIDLSGANGGNLDASGGLGITFEGQVLTQGVGAAGDGGDVTLTSSGGSISIHTINTSGGAGSPNGDAGDITLTPSSGLSGGFPTGLIVINGDLGSDGNLVAAPGGSGALGGTVTLSAGRSAPTTVATITSSLGGNDVYIRGADILIGANEAMTVLGNLQFVAENEVELSDTVALGSLVILSTTTSLNLHGDYEILSNLGTLYTTPSLHFFGGSGYTNTGALDPPVSDLDARSLDVSAGAFRPLLVYDNHILNFDIEGFNPPLPLTYPAGLAQFLFYQLIVADAQLSDLLPIFQVGLAPFYRLCPQPDGDAPVNCSSYELLQTRFKSR